MELRVEWGSDPGTNPPLECYRTRCVTIEEQAISPTDKQAQACLRVCQMLSNGYRSIHLFRFDPQRSYVYILADQSIEVVVPPDGNWYFP